MPLFNKNFIPGNKMPLEVASRFFEVGLVHGSSLNKFMRNKFFI